MKEEDYNSSHQTQEGSYDNLILSDGQFAMVQNLFRYKVLCKKAKKNPRDTSARWEIDDNWVHCAYLDGKGLVTMRNDQELPDSPVICVCLTPPIKD